VENKMSVVLYPREVICGECGTALKAGKVA